MARKAGDHLRHDPIKLRFTTTNPTTGQPNSILRRYLNQSIAEIMVPPYSSPTRTVILYEKLDASNVELETKGVLEVTWMNMHNTEMGAHSFLLPKTSTVHDLADRLTKEVELTSSGIGKIRIFEISKDGKTQKGFTGSEMIENMPEPVDLYAEVCLCNRRASLFMVFQEIPREELNADGFDKVQVIDNNSKSLSDCREKEFDAEVFRSRLSTPELTYKVHTLNAEVFQASASLISSIVRSNQEISEEELNLFLIRSKSLLGFSLAQVLQTEAKLGKVVNPLLVQVTLQAVLVNFCVKKIQLWTSQEPLINEFLNDLYYEIRTSSACIACISTTRNLC